MSPRARRAYVIALALAGILFALAVTWATSQIVSQRIGLSSEPVSAGLRLLPARRHAAGAGTSSTPAAPTTAPRTEPAPVPSVPTTGGAERPREAEAPARGSRGEGGDGASSRDD